MQQDGFYRRPQESFPVLHVCLSVGLKIRLIRLERFFYYFLQRSVSQSAVGKFKKTLAVGDGINSLGGLSTRKTSSFMRQPSKPRKG